MMAGYFPSSKITVAISNGDGHWLEVPAYCVSVEYSIDRDYQDIYRADGYRDFCAGKREIEVTAHFRGAGEFMHYFDADFIAKTLEEKKASAFIICPYCGLSNKPEVSYCGENSPHGCGGSLAE